MEDNKDIELTDEELKIVILIGFKLVKDLIKVLGEYQKDKQANTV